MPDTKDKIGYDDLEDFGLEYSFEQNIEKEEGAVTEIYSTEDGFHITMNESGFVDLKYWAGLAAVEPQTLIEQYEGRIIWQDPKVYELEGNRLNGWLTKEQYVKGNIIKKYQEALEFQERTGLFAANVQVLKENLPQKLMLEEIHVNLGATWVPAEFVVLFVRNLLEMYVSPRIEYNAVLGKWIVNCSMTPAQIHNYSTYGTYRMSAIKIVEHILNNVPVKVFDAVPRYDKDGNEYVLNETETLYARQKEEAIKAAWQDFIHGDRIIEEKLQEEFMLHFGYTVSSYDGSYLTLADMNPEVTLYPHQKNAIARIILNKNVLLAHNVGAGKTFAYSCGIHELIRLGQAKKALVVVPNTTLLAAANAHRDLYPQDKVWVVRPKIEFATTNRTKTLEIIKSDEYQIIFIAYSSFDMLTMSKKYVLEEKSKEIKALEKLIENTTHASLKLKLQTRLKKVRKKWFELFEESKDTETACFDELGVDILCVDEAHNYKNIPLECACDNIVGLNAAGSKKAENMLSKIDYMHEKQGRVIFATGTPLTNSMADLYVLQRYLQPEELQACGIHHFNDWIMAFAEEEHGFEIDVDSRNYKQTARFSKFHNLPELMGMFSNVCDFYQSGEGELGLPDFNGYTDILVKCSNAQKEYIEKLAERTEAVRKHEVSRKEDNLLLITVHGRMVALDIRLVEAEAVLTGEECKVKACAREMATLYHAYPETTQLAFSDISTPKESFNVYDELKAELVKAGVKPEEVKFVHEATNEAKREKLEEQFNAGKIRILIGSTVKLGTGTNVQSKLLAIHHLDIPWRPSDMVQRGGRILRQGNTNKEVFEYRYITESSFDAYTYQILENKQKFISQFLSGNLSAVHREETDCADTVLNYAEVKALAIGNPLIKVRFEVANELERARMNQRQKRKELGLLSEQLGQMPKRIKNIRVYIRNLMKDIEHYRVAKETVSNEQREAFGTKLLDFLGRNILKEWERFFGSYQGFDIILPKNMTPEKPYVILTREGSNRYNIKMDGDKARGCSRRLDYVLEHLEETLEESHKQLQSLYKQQEQAHSDLDKGNEYDRVVLELTERLNTIDKDLLEGKRNESE